MGQATPDEIVTPVPEPSMIPLLGAGAFALWLVSMTWSTFLVHPS
ncbi:MAG: PEP-CTERM sorting domain-containing protein [Gammaproteobacteria bacterium]|nr:PEP-CTERM sorting domain-containing protein [Gammaproteobacteria bacterium]